MRRIFFRSLFFCLAAVLLVGAFIGWRAYNVYRTGVGGYKHLRYLLESGETIEGEPAEDVLSDDYLMGLFGNNPELVERLKTIVDLGMATDESLKTGEITAMVVSYQKDGDEIKDPAIYAIGGFADPKSTRLGFHSSGFFQHELDPSLWLSGTTVMNMLGRDIILFCEHEKAEQQMTLLYDILNGGILSLAKKIVNSPVHYAIVFPSPRDIVPPNLRNHLQTIFITGVMGPDDSSSEVRFITGNPIRSAHVHAIVKDMLSMARMTFHDNFSGYVKERGWGKQDDVWWATDYVAFIDKAKLSLSPDMVTLRLSGDRAQNNAILKTIERAGRDLAMQRAFSLSGARPWEFVTADLKNPYAGYWSRDHLDGPEWPLGDEGVATPGSIAAAAARKKAAEEAAAAKAAAEEQKRREQEEQQRQKAAQSAAQEA